jgi:hypothetical protein
MLGPARRAAAEIAAIRSSRCKEKEGKDQVAGPSSH